MGFFQKRAVKGSRRSFKLWRNKFRKSGLIALGAILVGAVAALLSMNGSFSGMMAKAGDAARAKSLAVSASAGFRVGEILVTGRQHITPEELSAKLNVPQNAPAFGVSVDALKQDIEKIPWVKSAAVARRLPGTIAIDIRERTPVALWQYKQKLSVIDAEGVVLTAENLDSYAGLPLVVGENAEKSAASLIDLLNAEPLISARTASAVRVGNRRWDLHLENGIVVKLPEKDPELALSRLARAETARNIFGKNISAIDLRLADRIVVEPKTASKENI